MGLLDTTEPIYASVPVDTVVKLDDIHATENERRYN